MDRNKKSDFPKADESTVTPEFHLLLDQVQLNKFKTYVTDVFFPDILARKAAKRNQERLGPGADRPPAEGGELRT